MGDRRITILLCKLSADNWLYFLFEWKTKKPAAGHIDGFRWFFQCFGGFHPQGSKHRDVFPKKLLLDLFKRGKVGKKLAGQRSHSKPDRTAVRPFAIMGMFSNQVCLKEKRTNENEVRKKW